MTRSDVPAGARTIAPLWQGLESTVGSGTFDPSMCADLPAAVRRWLTSSIEPGAPMARRVRLSMDGEILLKAWRRFSAEQIIVPGRGFIWSARTRVGGLPVSGFDRFVGETDDAEGEMRWKLARLIPVMTADGPDVTRSAAGRLAAESSLVPTTFDGASWTGIDDATFEMTWHLPGDHTETCVVEIDDDGTLRRVSVQRWGNPFDRGYGRYRFVVDVSDPRRHNGIALPTTWSARWEDADTGERSEFFRATVTAASYR